MKQTKVTYAFFVLSILALIAGANAHQGHEHHKALPLSESQEQNRKIKLEKINDDYKQRIKPIFQRSCFDCHSTQTKYPWYYKIPGAKGLIDSDIAEAKKHIDLSHDFPFQGHGSPEEDLPAIRKAIEGNTMPPFRYKILHPNAKLSEPERKAILQWINEGLESL